MFSYSGDPGSSAKDQVRFLVADTEPTRWYLSDEEIAFLLEEHSSVRAAALAAAEQILAIRAGEVDRSVGDLRVSASQRYAQYREVVARLRRALQLAAAPRAGGISVAEKEAQEADPDRVEPAFSRRLHTFPADPFGGNTQGG